MQWLGIFLISIVGIIIFSILISGADIKHVMANWDTRRCEVPVMFTSFLYKPKHDNRSAGEFSTDNFNYCVARMAKEVAAEGMAPFFSVLAQQIGVANGIAPVLNSMRGMLSSSWGDFSKIFQEQYTRMSIIMLSFTRVYQHLRFAMGKIHAAAVAAVYGGISLLMTILNVLGFIKMVVMIVVGIIIALMIIFWPYLTPLMVPLVAPAIIICIMIEVQLGKIDLDIGTQHCCDPHAEVRMKDGTYKRLHELTLQDELYTENQNQNQNQNQVKGILYVDAKNARLVSIGGVLMSDTHRVYLDGTWVLARDHPEKMPPPPGTVLERLICLNTTQHIVPLKGCTVGDWEEVSSEEGRRAWIEFVAKTLKCPVPTKTPSAPPLLSSTTHVYNMDTQQWIPLWKVQLGDRILSHTTDNGDQIPTRVRCIYYGTTFVHETEEGNFISDGVWVHQKGEWALFQSPGTSLVEKRGIYLISDSGCFTISSNNQQLCVRDFTEVGDKNLENCYSMLSDVLKKEQEQEMEQKTTESFSRTM